MAFTRREFYNTLNAESAAVGWLVRNYINYQFVADAEKALNYRIRDDHVGHALIEVPKRTECGIDWSNPEVYAYHTTHELLEFLAGVRIGARLMPPLKELQDKILLAIGRKQYHEVDAENARRELSKLQKLCPCPVDDIEDWGYGTICGICQRSYLKASTPVSDAAYLERLQQTGAIRTHTAYDIAQRILHNFEVLIAGIAEDTGIAVALVRDLVVADATKELSNV